MNTVAHVLRPAVGGMLRHWQALAAHAQQNGFRTFAISSEANDLTKLREYAEKVLVFPLSAAAVNFSDLWSLVLLRRYVRELSPDIVHFHGFKSALVGAAALGKTKHRLVYTIHNYLPGTGRLARLYPLLECFTARRCSAVICVSKLQLSYLTQIPGYPTAPVRLIYNGINPARFVASPATRQHEQKLIRAELGLPSDALIILTVARLIPAKGLGTLFQAAETVGRAFRSAHFIIAGGGPEQADYLAQTAAINNRLGRQVIRLVGMIPDLLPYYGAADLFVLPSRSEGLPLSILEAQAAGLGVVASRVGGIPEAVVHGQTGLLVTPKDPHELAEAISELLADSGKRSQFGAAGRDRITSQFTEESMVTKTYALYHSLLQQGGRR